MSEIEIVPARDDNYQYLVIESGKAAVIDPVDADSIAKVLEQRQLELELILVTHHHYDHIAGIPDLVKGYAAHVHGADDRRIPELHRGVKEGDSIPFGRGEFVVIETPGHGDLDLSYLYVRPAKPNALFPGDTLFVSGCGRVLEGSIESLWASLKKLADFSDDTKVYCGHEYSEENAGFACMVEPNNPIYRARLDEIREIRRNRQPTVPSSMGVEKRANPFLRCESVETFADLRCRKNDY